MKICHMQSEHNYLKIITSDYINPVRRYSADKWMFEELPNDWLRFEGNDLAELEQVFQDWIEGRNEDNKN